MNGSGEALTIGRRLEPLVPHLPRSAGSRRHRFAAAQFVAYGVQATPAARASAKPASPALVSLNKLALHQRRPGIAGS